MSSSSSIAFVLISNPVAIFLPVVVVVRLLYLYKGIQPTLIILYELIIIPISIIDILEHWHNLLACWQPIFIDYNRLNQFIILLHYIFIFQLIKNFIQTLYVSVYNLSMLRAVTIRDKIAPFNEVKLNIKVQDEKRVQHIYKRKAHALLRLEIHR